MSEEELWELVAYWEEYAGALEDVVDSLKTSVEILSDELNESYL